MKKSVKYAVTALVLAVFAFVTVPAITLCIVFPNKYTAQVGAAADEFGLDRTLVKSVVWAESKFDKKATSNKGAKGLMQMMPETFDMCAKALGMDKSEADIYDVNCSLRCGCYYLSLLIDKFDGNVTAALMAYNAGEANAQKFLEGVKVFPETQNYLKNIAKARRVYGLFA